ncbi:Hsp70 family protein [Streptomyces melanogenes]|uniref:Hsp70 family protein n=1 Tax=Streptomyces melanogenes TaxID=67326 RepID=A0ABZ1XWQ6_9ACTN|nr:Hsp70 family protein [Streptomyces melanogenes]
MNVAVAVGCSRYEDEDIADLRFAHRDALRMRDTLAASMDIPSDAVFAFADGLAEALPTRHNVLRTIAQLATHATAPIDRLFFFFSGHGFHSTVDGNDYLITRESLTSALEETSLRFDLLVRMLRATGAAHVVLLLDACRTAVAGGKSLSPTAAKVDVEKLCPPGMVSFCSCAPETSSYESARLESGIFSQALHEAFGDEGRCVTVGQLDAFLTERVPRLARQYEKPLQRPYSRVEPAALVDLELVSPRKRNEWRASAGVGEEVRQRSVVRGGNVRVPEHAIFAIDFGTTTSVIAVMDTDRNVRLLPAGDGRKLVPSVVTFLPDFSYLVGSRAVELEHFSPGRTVRAVKRHLGTDYALSLDGKELSPELLASLVIRSLRGNAEDALGRLPQDAVIAYPANFSIRQANSLLRAFELVGLSVARMVGEPNVAAYLLLVDRPGWEGTALVVDLGGGTLDVAVVDAGDGVLEVKSVYGDNHLGGLDFDAALAARLKQRLFAWNSAVVFDTALESQILKEAERAKQLLTTHQSAVVAIQDIEVGSQVVSHDFTVDRAEFRDVCEELTARFAYVARTAVDDAWDRPPIDAVLLTGQGGKTFTIREALERLLPDAEFIDLYQEFAVCHGLAMQAGVLQGLQKDVLLLDMSHRGIGIRCTPVSASGAQGTSGVHRLRKTPAVDASSHVLVDRLTTIPTKRSEEFVFEGPPGADVVIPVIEKSKTSHEDVEICTVTLPARQEQVHVELTVDIDANSVMVLDVADRTNNTHRRFQLNHHYRQSRSAPGFGYREIDLLLDGCAVYELEWADTLARSPEERAVSVPRTLADVDIAELITGLDEDHARGAILEWQLPQHFRRKARLLLALGRRDEAARALAEAVRRRASGAESDYEWKALAADLDLAHRELNGTPALALVRNAVQGLLTHDRRPVSSRAQEVARALKSIGAHKEARRLGRFSGWP